MKKQAKYCLVLNIGLQKKKKTER